MKLVERLAVFLAGLVSVCYLLNLGAGIFVEIPDNIPLIGNLDEAAATTILLSVLSYFGFDLTRLFKARERASGRKGGRGEVIDVESERTDGERP